MVQLILVIIIHILSKVILYGLSLMINVSDNLIQEISNLIVLVVKIGEDKVKVLIYVYMKKLKKHQ